MAVIWVLVNQETYYLLLINIRINGLCAQTAALVRWLDMWVRKGLFRLSNLRLASVTACNT